MQYLVIYKYSLGINPTTWDFNKGCLQSSFVGVVAVFYVKGKRPPIENIASSTRFYMPTEQEVNDNKIKNTRYVLQ